MFKCMQALLATACLLHKADAGQQFFLQDNIGIDQFRPGKDISVTHANSAIKALLKNQKLKSNEQGKGYQKYKIVGQLRSLLASSPQFDDKLIDRILFSTRPNVHHLLYDEVMELMYAIVLEFPEIVEPLESIGQTYQGRDMFLIKIDAHNALKDTLGPDTQEESDRKAILLTGAHHSRELVSVQMPLYAVISLLHGYVHQNPESLALLKRNKYFVLPMVNVDGSHTIMEEWEKTGELVLKRKNNNFQYEKAQGLDCPFARKGVDINRNYGYLWGNSANGPCSESYPGPHAFSEPETKAMRNMLNKYHDTIKFVYNFHAFGPMYVWPYNGEIDNELEISNPEAQRIFNEIWDGAKFPEVTLKGNAIKTVGYTADGECNDYIMKQYNIPSVSPELANDDYFSNSFFIEYDFVARGVLKDNWPWIKHTFKKLAGEIKLNDNDKAFYIVDKVGKVSLNLNIQNIGLSKWELEKQHQVMDIIDSTTGKILARVALPNLEAREKKNIVAYLDPMPKASKGADLSFIIKYPKFAVDSAPTYEHHMFRLSKMMQ